MGSDATSKKQIYVVGAIVVRGESVLCARRGEHMSLPGLWEFPGGKIEAGETPPAALAREIVEELRCEILVGDHVETTAYEYDFGVVHLSTYYATVVSGEPQATEHAEIRWIPALELNSLEWAPADIPAVERVIADAVR